MAFVRTVKKRTNKKTVSPNRADFRLSPEQAAKELAHKRRQPSQDGKTICEIGDIIDALNRTAIRRSRSGEPGTSTTIYLPLSEMQVELRRLVAIWMDCGRNLKSLFAIEPLLAQRSKNGRTVLYVGMDGKANLDWFPVTPEEHLVTEKYDFSSPNDTALRLFINLIVSPSAEMLAGPCGRCDGYFLRKTKHARRYCSKTCSSSTTAVSAIKRKRERERKEKLRLAKARICEWSASSTRVDWVRWMVQDTRFSNNWLTRAVKSKELKPPRAKSKADGRLHS